MKYVQVIDGAENCSYSVYAVTEEDFAVIFPGAGQDVEFVEDVVRRLGERAAGELVMRATWGTRVEKAEVRGIHGTWFFGLEEKKRWYPNKREADLDVPGNRGR